MISEKRSKGTSTLVLEKPNDLEMSPRILELRKKIQNQEYLDNAIQRIAQVISSHLIDNSEELKFRD